MHNHRGQVFSPSLGRTPGSLQPMNITIVFFVGFAVGIFFCWAVMNVWNDDGTP